MADNKFINEDVYLAYQDCINMCLKLHNEGWYKVSAKDCARFLEFRLFQKTNGCDIETREKSI